MKITDLSASVTGSSSATVEMLPGDNLSLVFTDLNGLLRVVTVDVQGKVMLLTDNKTDSSLLVRAAGVYFHQGREV